VITEHSNPSPHTVFVGFTPQMYFTLEGNRR
jgi:hypothetical protein